MTGYRGANGTFGATTFDDQMIDYNYIWDDHLSMMEFFALMPRWPRSKEVSTPWFGCFVRETATALRTKEHVHGTGDMFAGDIDHNWRLDGLRDAFADYTHLIYSTTQSQVGAERYRFCLRLTRSLVDEPEHLLVWHYINQHFLNSQMDKATKNINRIQYVPAQWRGADNEFAMQRGGNLVDADAAIEVMRAQPGLLKMLAPAPPIDVVRGSRPARDLVSPRIENWYRSMKKGGRFYRLCCAAARRGLNKGWSFTASDLYHACTKLDAMTPGSEERDIREVKRAMASAERAHNGESALDRYRWNMARRLGARR